MFSDEVVLRVVNLCKCYEIYKTPGDRLKQFLVSKLLKIIGLEQKRVYFEEFWALKNISFEVKKRQTVGIIGKNGSGKSTLLQLICGTLNPTHGEVEINGRVAALLELGSGFNLEFTGKENIYLNAAILGLNEAEINARYQDIVDFADIGEFIGRPVKTYSSGMLVRLAFAVIAHVDADILVIDEALSVGDAFFTQKCMRFLHEFMKTKTILFVSHDVGAVLNLCDYAYHLSNGMINFSGSPKKVVEQYLGTLYAGGAPVNICSNIDSDYPTVEDENIRGVNSKSPTSVVAQAFHFDSSKRGNGDNKVRINSVFLLNLNGEKISTITKQQLVTLKIDGETYIDINNPIVGFELKDRLGQAIFAENTFLAFQDNPPKFKSSSRFRAEFCFLFPVLSPGEYSFSVVVGNGTQENHKQHQWIFDCLIVHVHASSVCFGLVGIPMKTISLSRIN